MERLGPVDVVLLDLDGTLVDHARAADAAVRRWLRARGSRLAVLSNRERAQQVDELRRTGLLDAVEAVLTSSELGAAKPDRAAFLGACERLGVGPSQVVHVGDDLQADVAGAAAAGLRVVWVDRTAAPAPHPAPPVRVTTLAGLPDLLR